MSATQKKSFWFLEMKNGFMRILTVLVTLHNSKTKRTNICHFTYMKSPVGGTKEIILLVFKQPTALGCSQEWRKVVPLQF